MAKVPTSWMQVIIISPLVMVLMKLLITSSLRKVLLQMPIIRWPKQVFLPKLINTPITLIQETKIHSTSLNLACKWRTPFKKLTQIILKKERWPIFLVTIGMELSLMNIKTSLRPMRWLNSSMVELMMLLLMATPLPSYSDNKATFLIWT